MGKTSKIDLEKIISNPLFIIGLLVKLTILCYIAPDPIVKWYLPFMDITTEKISLDLWQKWLQNNGSYMAFPYGYIMWICFLPLTLLCKFCNLPLLYGYGVTILMFDTAMLILLYKIIGRKDRLIFLAYWFSPIVIVATYVQGYNDLVPVTFVLFSLYYIKLHKPFLSGIFFIGAVSAKISMVIAFPFYIIYFINNKTIRKLVPKFIKGLSLGIIFLILPAMLSSSAINMLVNNPEINKIYKLAIHIDENSSIFIFHLLYIFILYYVWSIRRLNFYMFFNALGLVFFTIILFIPSNPGWYIWSIPLLIMYQTTKDMKATILTTLFSVFFVLTTTIFHINMIPHLEDNYYLLDNTKSMVFTIFISIGILLVSRIYRDMISRNNFFRISRKPFVIGIGGDSGSGKTTLADSLEGLFGDHSVSKISGDDYHLWDRYKPMWNVITHLNPIANDLEEFSNNLIRLTERKNILSKNYNHKTGKIDSPRKQKSNDIVIASGLHVFYSYSLRKYYDIKIFLDIDEQLRKYLKIKRDTTHRKHSVDKVIASIKKREKDSARFIEPQAGYADLILSLRPINDKTQEWDDNLPLKLVVTSKISIDEHALMRALVGICGLYIDIEKDVNTADIKLTIEGEPSAEDVFFAAKLIAPRILEFLTIEPDWQNGMVGIMQLITILYIDHILRQGKI